MDIGRRLLHRSCRLYCAATSSKVSVMAVAIPHQRQPAGVEVGERRTVTDGTMVVRGSRSCSSRYTAA